jgi:hypothetical protein
MRFTELTAETLGREQVRYWREIPGWDSVLRLPGLALLLPLLFFHPSTVIALGTGGVGWSDSANFVLGTSGFPPGNIGGVAYADSANFTLDTGGFAPRNIGGVTYADSANFTLNTSGLAPGNIGGVTYADSASFIQDTSGFPPGKIGGVTYADSANLTLDTSGFPLGNIGGVAWSDSGTFTLDTTGLPPAQQARRPFIFGPMTVSGGSFQFDVSNFDQNASSFTVLTTTNLLLPLPNWTVAGTAVNIAPNLYQFTLPATNRASFYIIRSP